MATITEDYVSFEIAKLLKEKGFDARCPLIYTTEGELLYTDVKHHNMYAVTNKQLEYYLDIIAPSQSMAMKWLREVHDLIIYVKLVNDGDLYHDAWGFVIYNKFTEENIKSDKLWFKYEEACEAAIKYCLENLI